MKSRPTGKHAGKWLSGCFLLFLLLAISACGGGNTTHVYDNARVLNTSKVQNTAANLPADVDIYTVNNFAGTQTEFQRAVQSKLGGNSNRIVMAVDTLHNYVYIAKGSSVPLSGTDISRSVNSFAANYGRGNYTGATVAALNTMNGPLQQANNRNSGPSPALWLLPLVILAGLLFMLFKARQPARVTRSTGYSPTPTYTPPRPDYPPQGGYRPSPRQEDTTSPPAAGGATDYDLGKRQGERRADASNRDNITGGGGRFGSGGSDYGSSESGGGGRFGSGGSDYGSSESGGGGRFGKGGSDYDQGRGSEYDKGGGRFGKGGSDYDQGSGSEYDKGGGRNF